MVNAQSEVAGRTRTSISGAYAIQAIPPGSYRLTVEAAGFRRRAFENAPVNSWTYTRFDLTLRRGSVGAGDPEQGCRLSALSQLLIEVELYRDILKQPPSTKKPTTEPPGPPDP